MNRSAVRRLCAVLGTLPLLVAPQLGFADERIQRFTLVVGANFGGAERPRLQYAVSDAERFARVLVELGGVSPENEIILRQPKLRDLMDGLDRLRARVVESRRAAGAAGGRSEVLVYYSGHADEQGLLLGDDRYSYRTLRERLDQIPADVRIAVLDACASGAFTRIKSGRSRPAFLVDQSSNMRGHAFLTSSAATEAAQESDRIRASYFTHYLVSGFRGAADLSGDGRVTLSEAYQFAFNETVGRTVDTKAGPQHPSYDINLSGTGDVVMTDLRQTSATLILAEDLDGRFFVRNARQELVVELYKPRGRRIELGVEPGTYEIRAEIQRTSRLAKASVAEGGQFVVEARQFGPATVENTRRRGDDEDAEGSRLAVSDRNRLSIRLGVWRSYGPGSRVTGAELHDMVTGIEYTRYLSESLSISLGAQGMETSVASIGAQGVYSGASSLSTMPVTLRWNPLAARLPNHAVKPYLAVAVGPVFGTAATNIVNVRTVSSEGKVYGTVGGQVGAGVDFHVFRSFAIGLNGGANWMRGFSQPGVFDTYSGPEVGVSLSWLFGRGR